MGWNGPDNGKDPWGGNKQPPDLDEALKRLFIKIKQWFRPALGKKANAASGSYSGADSNSGQGSGSGSVFVTLIGLSVLALWGLSGIFIVDPAEEAAILRFGRYVGTVGPGPHWIPRMISSKVVLNVDRVSDYSYAAQMLTKDENLVSVAVAVQYRIGDLSAYLFNVADPEESLQQATSSALRQVVGTTTLDHIITEGRDAWGSNVQDVLVKTLARYNTGIVIVNVSPQPARAPENVQDAFDDAIKAQEDEKRFKEQAHAYAAKVLPIAEGNAKRIYEEAKAFGEKVVLTARGETAEFLELLPQYTQAPFVTGERMYLDAMQRVLASTSKIVVDGKAGNLLYLPLDKLVASAPNATEPLVHPNVKERSKSDELVLNLSEADGRELNRPTKREGRTSE